MKTWIVFITLALVTQLAAGQNIGLGNYDITWTTQSKNSSESMPCGGGDIGLNVWVENGDILFYAAKSGSYDENNALLKAGRVRLFLSPNPFDGGSFKQVLHLQDGFTEITGVKNGLSAQVKIWADVFNPQIHIQIQSSSAVNASATYETWRYRDLYKSGLENNENAYKFSASLPVISYRDSITHDKDGIIFFHRNRPGNTAFDITVKQQGLSALKNSMFDPLKNLTFGGALNGEGMIPAGKTTGTYANTPYMGWILKSKAAKTKRNINLTLYTQQAPHENEWRDTLLKLHKLAGNARQQKSIAWWHQFWKRSFIYVDVANAKKSNQVWQAGRNYQLFRYMLACNTFGNYPTKFNGGLFTYDPSFTNAKFTYTPDFRNWGGSIFTAQNQRLVYFPLIKGGDFDVLQPQLDFYLRILNNAQLATHAYWPHTGARFTEQIENFGLSNMAEYGVNRPVWLDPGVDYNPWLEYHWETVLEFCLMMLESSDYSGEDVKTYLPFIESTLDFFDQHYQYLALQRGSKALDGNGKLVLFPGSAAETFKMAYNSTSTIAGLKTILEKLIALPVADVNTALHEKFEAMLERIPSISTRYINSHETIAPAQSWERINNEESPQLYPVYPWGIYGVGKPDLKLALDTWQHDTSVVKFRNYVGWKQDNIFAARLGLIQEAAKLTFSKLKDSGRRFPAFWGPGFDWTPDHNWGGSGMIGLQEMLLQVADEKIYIFPAWPKKIDVHFKLHAPKQTIVECELKNGKVTMLKVLPESRMRDVIIM